MFDLFWAMVRKFHKGWWSPSLLIVVPHAGSLAIRGEWHGMTQALQSLVGVDAGLLWGFILFFFCLFYLGHADLRKRDRKALKKLEDFIGSKKLDWVIDPKLVSCSESDYAFHGHVDNRDVTVTDAQVHLLDFGNEQWKLRWADVALAPGRNASQFNLHHGGNLPFNILKITDDIQPVKIVGDAGGTLLDYPIDPGVYDFTLRLLGQNFKSRDCKVKIEVLKHVVECVRLLKVEQENYPETEYYQPKWPEKIAAACIVVGTLCGAYKIARVAQAENLRDPQAIEATRRLEIRNRLASFESAGEKIKRHLTVDPLGSSEKNKKEVDVWVIKVLAYLQKNLEKSDYERFRRDRLVTPLYAVPDPQNGGLWGEVTSRNDDLEAIINRNR